MYAITLHQPWASLIALGVKTVETRSWPAPERLVGQAIAIHAGKRVIRQPVGAIEQAMWAHLGEDWRKTIPAGAVLATAVLSGMARVARVDLSVGLAVHDGITEAGCATGLGRTRIDLWGDFGPGRWLWFLAREAGFKARRWVVERTHSWLNRFRRILVRWDKSSENYIAFLHFAGALISLRPAGLLG